MRSKSFSFWFALTALVFLIGSTIAMGSGLEMVTLKVEGMECRACVKTVRKALLKVPGVKAAEVRLVDKEAMIGEARVEYEKDKTTPQQLIGAVEAASNPMITYKASVIVP